MRSAERRVLVAPSAVEIGFFAFSDRTPHERKSLNGLRGREHRNGPLTRYEPAFTDRLVKGFADCDQALAAKLSGICTSWHLA
jgi:hypothetical protein